MAHSAAASGNLEFFNSIASDQQSHDGPKKPKRRLSTLLSSLFNKQPAAQSTSTAALMQFNSYGFAPIHTASFHGHQDILQILLTKFQLNPNQPTHPPCKITLPLNLAILRNNVSCVKMLLKHAANPYLRDGEGWDAWEMAKRNGRRRSLKLLNEYREKEEEGCLNIIQGGACWKRESRFETSQFSNSYLPLHCSDCDHSEDTLKRICSDSSLAISSNKKTEIYHANKRRIPYGPWDIECGLSIQSDPRESDLDTVSV